MSQLTYLGHFEELALGIRDQSRAILDHAERTQTELIKQIRVGANLGNLERDIRALEESFKVEDLKLELHAQEADVDRISMGDAKEDFIKLSGAICDFNIGIRALCEAMGNMIQVKEMDDGPSLAERIDRLRTDLYESLEGYLSGLFGSIRELLKDSGFIEELCRMSEDLLYGEDSYTEARIANGKGVDRIIGLVD